MPAQRAHLARTLVILIVACPALAAGCGQAFDAGAGGADASPDRAGDGPGVVLLGEAGEDAASLQDASADASDLDAPSGPDAAGRDAPGAEASPGDASGADSAPVDASRRDSAGDGATEGGACGPPGPGVFVQAGSAFSAPGCGLATTPCGTIQAGIDVAVAQSLPSVYVGHGTYVEAVTISAGPLTVQGGWTLSGSGWTHDCPASPSAAVLRAPAGVDRAASITGGQVTLDTLTIENATTAAAGQTLFGVVATGGTLALGQVVLTVAPGGAGLAGATGAGAGKTPPTCAAGSGAAGATGTAGPGAGPGSYSAAGFTPASGAAGGHGGAGHDGKVAPAQGQAGGPTCVAGVACHRIGGTCNQGTLDSCGVAGTNGCGGLGSSGGQPGEGGGSSVGLFAWGANVHFAGDASVSTGAGGQGGDGGSGGAVGVGSAGQGGRDALTSACQGCDGACHGVSCLPGLAGAAGGTGGSGGPGGLGGGGSGGDSYCYYAGGGASVTVGAGARLSCTPGAAGAGGDQGGGAAQGAAGTSAAHN